MKRTVFSILFVSFFAFCFVQNVIAQGVSNLKAVQQQDGSALISWSYSGSTTTVKIFGGSTPGGVGGPQDWTEIGSVSSTVTSFKHSTPAKLPSRQFYRVLSGQEATPPVVPLNALPPAPGGLKATPGDGKVMLSWTPWPPSLPCTYNVKSALSAGGPFNSVKTGLTTSSFTVTGLTNGTTQHFVVSAFYNGTESPNSAPVSATPIAPVVKLVPAPTGLSLGPVKDTVVSLTWNAVPGATSYNVKKSTSSSGPFTTVKTINATSFAVAGLTPSTKCFFVVSASNAQGESPNSSPIEATTRAALN